MKAAHEQLHVSIEELKRTVLTLTQDEIKSAREKALIFANALSAFDAFAGKAIELEQRVNALETRSTGGGDAR